MEKKKKKKKKTKESVSLHESGKGFSSATINDALSEGGKCSSNAFE